MMPTALVVDDDPQILEDVRERLEGLGHTCVTAGCADEARARLVEGHGLDYVLLDLELPTRYGKPALTQHGLNVLAHANKVDPVLPVVVMTAHGLDSFRLPAEVMRHGQVCDYIRKPFPRPGDGDRTLETAARDACDRRHHALAADAQAVRPFAGGTLIFHPDRVELDGVAICGDEDSGMMRRILDRLRVVTAKGTWRGWRGTTLAQAVGASDAGSVARTICTFRSRARDRLLADTHTRLSEHDLITSGGTGYRFGPTIRCRDGGEGGAADGDASEAGSAVAQVDTQPDQPPGDPTLADLNDRQIQILDRLRAGERLRKRQLVDDLGVSEKTVKRDLSLLKAKGLAADRGSGVAIEWVAS